MANLAGSLKPDGQKVTRTKPAFDWINLPATGRVGAPPRLPALRPWTKATRDAWKSVWSSPQATQWDQSGRTMWVWAVLHHDLVVGDRAAASVSAELRQHEDRHGLNPKAMLQLRWRVVDENADLPDNAKPAKVRRMRVVDTGAMARS